MFKIEDYNNKKIAIHTKTQEEYDKLMEMLKKSGIDTMNLKIWRHNKNETCVTIKDNDLNWCDKPWYLKQGYKIVEFSDIVPFTKSDLQDNDIVTLKNGEVKVWEKWKNGLAYKKYLKAPTDYRSYDIIKVERPTELTTVFEREEKIKISIKELVKYYEEKEGKKVEVE